MSNVYAIDDTYDLHSTYLSCFAREHHLWHDDKKLHFAQTFQGTSPCTDARLQAGRQLLTNLTEQRQFSVFDMINILRDDRAGICVDDHVRGVCTTSSQVSILKSNESHVDGCHFFTGTPHPRRSLFKPFIFSNQMDLSHLTRSSSVDVESRHAAVHPLYAAHRTASWSTVDQQRLLEFERTGINEIIARLQTSTGEHTDEYDHLFHDAVSAEIELLR
jgi:secernin